MATQAQTIASIKNNALLHIGSTVVDFDTDTISQKAITCNTLYPSLKTKLLSLRNWTFAFKKAELSGKTELTGEVYLYSYDAPADLINLLRLFPGNNSRTTEYDYQLRGGKIYSNSPELWAEYTYNVDETSFSAVFIDFFEYAFASEICFKLTGDKVLQEQLHQRAWGLPSDNFKGGLFGFASLTDQKQQPVQIIEDSPLLIARNEGIK